MKLLVDMNLSPSWVGRLAQHGFEAVHWSTIGAVNAPDVEILAWANEHQFVVITNDLDFSAILAASAGAAPSVVQIRTQDLLSDEALRIVAKAIEVHREDIERGALLSIDEGGTRLRMLPLKGSQGSSEPQSHSPPQPSFHLLVADCWTSIDEKQGHTDSGAVFPLLGARLPVETRGGVNVVELRSIGRCSFE